MARKQANPTLVMLVQQLRPELWGHLGADPVVAEGFAEVHRALETMPEGPERIAYMQQVAAWLGGLVAACWEVDGRTIADCHAVLHDLDTVNSWDEVAGSTVEVAKELHMHLLVKFTAQAASASVDKLAALVGVEPQYLGLDKSRGGSAVEVCGKKIAQQYDNGLSYLVHAKYPEKHQYRPEQVATVRGAMPYEQIYAERYDAWVRGRAHVVKKRAAENAEHLREQVLTGAVTREQIMLTDELYEVYSRNARIIDEALSIYGQRRAYKAASKLRAGVFSTAVVFIHGQAGSGKTQAAQALAAEAMARAAAVGERWAVYRAATGNPLDDLNGEEILLLDDLRAGAMDASDWLLLLDPHNANPARARYRNKSEVAPRLIIITAPIEPIEFFYYTRQKGAVDEALDQFIRRLMAAVRVIRVGTATQYEVQRVAEGAPYALSLDGVPVYKSAPDFCTYGHPMGRSGMCASGHTAKPEKVMLTRSLETVEAFTESDPAVKFLMRGLAAHPNQGCSRALAFGRGQSPGDVLGENARPERARAEVLEPTTDRL